MIKRIEVDRDLCIGAASCVVIAEKVFQLDQENKAIVVDPHGENDETILEAAKSCPVQAIFLYDENDQQIFP